MKRLVDDKQAEGSAQARLADLVAASEPLTLSDDRKRATLDSVLQRRRVATARRPLWLRPALTLGVLLVASVTAAATLGYRWVTRDSPSPAPVAPAVVPAKPQAVRPAPPAAPAADEVVIPPQVSEASRPATKTVVRPRPAKGEDPSLVVAAIQALRHDHEPARAAKLLADYLRTYPHGALAEEAVALSIEAATESKRPEAKTFAAQYLAQYPKGRFRRIAEQALR